jgi:hypothetical protein
MVQAASSNKTKEMILAQLNKLDKEGEAYMKHAEKKCRKLKSGHIPFSLEVKEYARAEGVSAGFGVDLESTSDLSRGNGVSETAEFWEKVQRTSARPHVDLVPGGNGTGMHLTHADT